MDATLKKINDLFFSPTQTQPLIGALSGSIMASTISPNYSFQGAIVGFVVMLYVSLKLEKKRALKEQRKSLSTERDVLREIDIVNDKIKILEEVIKQQSTLKPDSDTTVYSITSKAMPGRTVDVDIENTTPPLDFQYLSSIATINLDPLQVLGPIKLPKIDEADYSKLTFSYDFDLARKFSLNTFPKINPNAIYGHQNFYDYTFNKVKLKDEIINLNEDLKDGDEKTEE